MVDGWQNVASLWDCERAILRRNERMNMSQRAPIRRTGGRKSSWKSMIKSAGLWVVDILWGSQLVLLVVSSVDLRKQAWVQTELTSAETCKAGAPLYGWWGLPRLLTPCEAIQAPHQAGAFSPGSTRRPRLAKKHNPSQYSRMAGRHLYCTSLSFVLPSLLIVPICLP